jgi:XapX domain-containing protein
MRLALGFVLAVLLGFTCRVARIPMPAPNAILGSLLAVAMSTGYFLGGKMLEKTQTKALRTTSSMGHDMKEQPSK